MKITQHQDLLHAVRKAKAIYVDSAIGQTKVTRKEVMFQIEKTLVAGRNRDVNAAHDLWNACVIAIDLPGDGFNLYIYSSNVKA